MRFPDGPAAAVLTGVMVALLGLPGVWARSTYGAQTSVDEPQYLMTALSLANDRDLDVSDEIDERLYLSFHELALNPQTTPVDADGRRFSPHDPLLPAILAPAMSFAPNQPGEEDVGLQGWVAARLTLLVIAAFTAAATTWLVMTRGKVRPAIAVAVVTLGFGGVPLAPYATQVYPEMSAALLAVVGVIALTSPQFRGRSTLFAVLVVVGLPWLAVKYVPVAAVLGGWLAVRLFRQDDRRMFWSVTAALALAGVVYAVFHQRVYGGWTVYAAGDHFSETGELSVVGVSPDYVGRSRRLVGLLTDRSFGLIPWQPLWLLAPASIGVITRRFGPGTTGALAAGYATATFVALTMQGWWSPGRQVVVIAPLLLAGVAVLVDRVPKLLGPAIALGTLGVMNWLWLVWEATTGRRTLVVDFTETGALPYRVVRAVFPDPLTGAAPGLTPVWIAVVSILFVLGILLVRRERATVDP